MKDWGTGLSPRMGLLGPDTRLCGSSACVFHGPVQDHILPSMLRPFARPINVALYAGAVKAWPVEAGASPTSTAAASLDCACVQRTARIVGRDEETLGSNKETTSLERKEDKEERKRSLH